MSFIRGQRAATVRGRALTEGLSVDQTDEEFDTILDKSIASIFEASKT